MTEGGNIGNHNIIRGDDQMKSLSVKLGVILIGVAIFGYAEVWGANWKFFENFTYKSCSEYDP